ncbi:acetoacetate decarboxylase family protein [Rhizohabitans arisaemae]|uniref:acetoacetate decarboxylase family protein n=1 Tax=Rhizohabitans arisaemae TaxID=2720610 RepID=UPI0024B18386|nr:acetoacetate decarboxylase family protein [Rhizohabitans arisaemae]
MVHHLIQGRTVTMPVEVREATAGMATYLVRADAARAIIAYSGLDVVEPLPGKAVCALAFIEYLDGDLGPYREFAVTFLVAGPGDRPVRRDRLVPRVAEVFHPGAGAFVHWLPVTQAFTMEAGQSIWGFPKELADVDIRMRTPYKRCVLRKDGRLVLDLLIKPGVPVPGGVAGPWTGRRGLAVDAYTHRDQVTRRVPWVCRAEGVRARPGGALIRLGNHPIAKELSELGLPCRALMTGSVRHLQMTFHGAEEAG